MVKTWNVTLEGKKKGSQDDWTLTFFDAAEFVEGKPLGKRYVDDMKYQIKNNSHYEAIKNVKQVKSSSGEEIPGSAAGVILATAGGGDPKIGFLFKETKTGGIEIFGLWPEDFAKVCKRKSDIYRAFLARLVQDPAFFEDVSVILPMG